MNSKTFNWGIIGPGRIAHKFAEATSVIDNCEIYAVASRDVKKAEEFSKQYNAEKTYSSYEDLVNDKNIDAVYIATPHPFHYEQTKLALEAGKNVLCEKPFTVNAKQAKELLDLAKEKNLFLMEALWTRFLPIYKLVRNWLDEKILGETILLTSTFGYAFERNLIDRKFNHALAGGALLDLGVYSIAISQWVLRKDPISFSASGFLGETNVDEMTAVNLNYGDRVVSQFSCNLLSKNDNSFIIYGSKGKIEIHNMFWAATKATLTIDGKEITEERPFKATGFEYQIEEVINCIKNGKLQSDEMTHERTLANLLLMDNIRKEIGLQYSFE
ncbi:MAG: Gfo/Idh/MocA family oxidoreductase [Ignavibacteriae bacterium]|nr:Gfo/Idh/MocA family oxidoreductase [Ignavibacteriota bacterium]